MADIETLQALLERVEKAKKPNVLLDRELCDALLCAKDEVTYWSWQAMRARGSPERTNAEFWERHAKLVTSSIDAALALAERVLPEFALIMGVYFSKPAKAGFRKGDAEFIYYEAATPALAICAALLRALIAKEQAK